MVLWINDGCTPNDVEYVLSVFNSTYSDPVKYVTNLMNITLNVMKDYKYIITVTDQLLVEMLQVKAVNNSISTFQLLHPLSLIEFIVCVFCEFLQTDFIPSSMQGSKGEVY